MAKHYKDYTVGELLDAGFQVEALHFDNHDSDEALDRAEIFDDLLLTNVDTGKHKWIQSDSMEDFRVTAYYEKADAKKA